MDNLALLLIGVGMALVVVLAVVYLRGRAGRAQATASRGGRLSKTAAALGRSLRDAWGSGIDASTWAEMEEALIAADMGVEASAEITAEVKKAKPATPEEAKNALSGQLKAHLDGRERSLRLSGHPAVLLVVGVNGTGKTTTIAKLGHRAVTRGRTVLFAAADTFRAAAREQLEAWGERVGALVVGGQEGGDPASVVFDALTSARAHDVDVVIVDTAGRLHGKKNLMAELSKIHRVASADRGEVDEVLLVLDATGGQNGLAQVRAFAESVPLTGIVLTKLDGTARGGIVLAIERRLGVPVKFVGLGEALTDLEPFDPDRFVDELLEGT